MWFQPSNLDLQKFSTIYFIFYKITIKIAIVLIAILLIIIPWNHLSLHHPLYFIIKWNQIKLSTYSEKFRSTSLSIKQIKEFQVLI